MIGAGDRAAGCDRGALTEHVDSGALGLRLKMVVTKSWATYVVLPWASTVYPKLIVQERGVVTDRQVADVLNTLLRMSPQARGCLST